MVWARWTVATVALAVALWALLAVPASAPLAVGAAPTAAADSPPSPNSVLSGTKSSGLATVLSPAPGGLVKGRTARIRVRLRRGARSFQAWLDTTHVTRRFRRRGKDRVATLSASRTPGLGLGVNHLFVRVRAPGDRRDFDVVRFIRARRIPSLLVQRLTGRVVRVGQVRITFSVARRSATVRAWLNGRRLRGLARRRSRLRRYVLDADDGLRFGRNHLKFVAIHNSGRFDVERRAIAIPRSAPIPSAGHSRRVLATRTVRLDATRSRPARRDGRLRFRWHIVHAPKGSKARLRGVRSARPVLRPDRVGLYRVRLTVRGRSPAAAAAGRARAAADTITLHATPPIPPVGVPIDTAAAAGGVGLGVHLGPPLNTRYAAPNRNEPIQMVALDRTDLSRVANNSYTGDPTGTAQLVSDVNTLHSSDLVIITTPASSQPRAITDPQALANLNQAVKAIGGAELPAAVVGTDDCLNIGSGQICTNFSVIGVPGQDAGTADQNAGLTLKAGRNVGLRGSLLGYLQADQTSRYQYVSGDFASFDTSTPASTATQNVMTINGQTFTSDTLPSGQAGFHLVIVEADGLDPQLNVTYPVSGVGVSDSDAAAGLSAIDGLLADAANDPTQLVFLQSIGSVLRADGGQGASLAWNAVATDMSGLGGSAFYFNALNGMGDGGTYAFVGPGDAPSFLSPWAKTSSMMAAGTPGRLTGVLARNTLSQYYPQLAGSQASLDFSLPSVAYQDPVPWPDRDTPGHLAALSCIAQALGLPPAPIESNYTNLNFAFASIQSSLGDLTFQNVQKPANPACENPTFTQQDFGDVQGQITQELRDGAGVAKLITNLQSPLGTSADAANANVLDIAQAIQSSLGNPNSNASGDTAQVLDDLIYVASGIVPEAGAALGVAASIAALANAALDDSSGGPLLGDVEANATELLVDFAEDYEALWGQIGTTGNILLSDWGKLRTAYQRSLTSWSWSPQDTTTGADALTAASKLFTFEALVPLQYQTYDFGDSGYLQSLPVPPPDGRDYQCPSRSLQFPDETIPQAFQPFAGAPTPGLTVVTQAGPVTDLWILGSTDKAFLSNDPDTRANATGPIPAKIYNAMFTDPTNENVSSPAVPSELRFDLDAYDGPVRLTSNGGFSPDVYCNVDGQRP